MAKITYGLSNIYYAKITTSEQNAVTYATPVAWKGAKELSLEVTGDLEKIYADDVVYFTADPAAGYEGELTMLTLPQSFCTDILGMRADNNGALVESEDDTMSQFALLGEFKHDSNERKRFVLYCCTAGKPTFGGSTKEETTEAHEYSIPITATAASDTGAVKASVTNATATKTQFDAWFSAVYTPSFTE